MVNDVLQLHMEHIVVMTTKGKLQLLLDFYLDILIKKIVLLQLVIDLVITNRQAGELRLVFILVMTIKENEPLQ